MSNKFYTKPDLNLAVLDATLTTALNLSNPSGFFTYRQV
jgi:hypothetical protein